MKYQWTDDEPKKSGWYWIRAKNLSARIDQFYHPHGQPFLTHTYRYGCSNTETLERYGPFEYAGPIPQPSKE